MQNLSCLPPINRFYDHLMYISNIQKIWRMNNDVLSILKFNISTTDEMHFHFVIMKKPLNEARSVSKIEINCLLKIWNYVQCFYSFHTCKEKKTFKNNTNSAKELFIHFSITTPHHTIIIIHFIGKQINHIKSWGRWYSI